MSWILDHFQVVIVVGSAIAYWLSQRRKAQEEQELSERAEQPVYPNTDVDGQAERTRRIQEEIRRKIMERMGGATSTQPLRPPPLREPPPVQTSMPVLEVQPDESDAAATEAQAGADRAVMDRQRVLADKLRELENQRREYSGRAKEFAVKLADERQTAAAPSGNLLAELRSPASARRAIVLRELLGTPVGLR